MGPLPLPPVIVLSCPAAEEDHYPTHSLLMRIPGLLFGFTVFSAIAFAQPHKDDFVVWNPDNGDGTFSNPLIHADYSDPDAIRVGDDYYLTASSFSHFPGLPILHSKDLVNWRIIGHAVQEYPFPEFVRPQHGMGIWAPSLRYRNGEFLIYFGDPDRGIFMTKAKNPAGPWEPLRLIRRVIGWIDPCPFWDDDGNAYLVHAFANTRIGIKSILAINKMSPDGLTILDDGIVVFVGHEKQPTLEGPKFHKRNGYYYVFAPAGGVKPGWQTVLRSKSIFGPYEDKIVLERGSTRINGPHQGAWVNTPSGEDWFIHFQDRYAYGRVVHLQPMRWEEDWPVMGIDFDGNGVGEPVAMFRKPIVSPSLPVIVPQTSDEFESQHLGFQWQWEANPRAEWYSLSERPGWLRLRSQIATGIKNLRDLPAVLGQKLPGPEFAATVKVECGRLEVGERGGLSVLGLDYSTIVVERTSSGWRMVRTECRNANKGAAEEVVAITDALSASVFLRVRVSSQSDTTVVPKVFCSFSYSFDGLTFKTLGPDFTAREGIWVGAKLALFASAAHPSPSPGFVDIDWIRFSE